MRVAIAYLLPPPVTLAEGGDVVETDFAQKCATEVIDEVRRAVTALVDREEARLCSRMLSYQHVGMMIGVSEHWVRRFVKRDPAATLNYVVGVNAMAIYRRIATKMD